MTIYSGYIFPDFSDIYYAGMSSDKYNVAFGFIKEETAIEVTLTNNADDTLSVSSLYFTDIVDVNVSGISVSDSIASGSTKSFNLVAEATGVDYFSGSLTISFSDGSDLEIYITGLRVLFFNYRPKTGGYSEGLYFHTAIFLSDLQYETRRQMMEEPLKSSTFTFYAYELAMFQKTYNLAELGVENSFIVPRWFNAMELTSDAAAGSGSISCSTDDIDIPSSGSLVLYRDSDGTMELVSYSSFTSTTITLSGVTSNSYSEGDFIIPYFFGRTDATFELSYDTMELSRSIEISFKENR